MTDHNTPADVARVRSYLHSEHRRRVVKVRANGVDIGQWEFDLENRTGERECVIAPAVWSKGGGVNIRFYIDSPAMPATSGSSRDVRALGIGLESLVLQKM